MLPSISDGDDSVRVGATVVSIDLQKKRASTWLCTSREKTKLIAIVDYTKQICIISTVTAKERILRIYERKKSVLFCNGGQHAILQYTKSKVYVLLAERKGAEAVAESERRCK